MKYLTNIEIDEIETEVLIDFENQFGVIIVNKITDVHTGDAIVPELSEAVYAELHEYDADLRAEKNSKRKLSH